MLRENGSNQAAQRIAIWSPLRLAIRLNEQIMDTLQFWWGNHLRIGPGICLHNLFRHRAIIPCQATVEAQRADSAQKHASAWREDCSRFQRDVRMQAASLCPEIRKPLCSKKLWRLFSISLLPARPRRAAAPSPRFAARSQRRWAAWSPISRWGAKNTGT